MKSNHANYYYFVSLFFDQSADSIDVLERKINK